MFSRGIEMEHWAKIGQNWRKQQLEVFCKKGGLRNFAKFKGKHLCQNLFLYSLSTLVKKRLWHRCFPVNFAKVLRTPFLQNTSRRLLLNWVHPYLQLSINIFSMNKIPGKYCVVEICFFWDISFNSFHLCLKHSTSASVKIVSKWKIKFFCMSLPCSLKHFMVFLNFRGGAYGKFDQKGSLYSMVLSEGETFKCILTILLFD